MVRLSSTVVVAPLLSLGGAAPTADEVTHLPGWNGSLPSRWWSGFLSVDGSQKQIHYTFVEKIDDPHAAQAPVVMWTNGGPGCSGYDGLLYEHGPLLISHDGGSLIYNEHTWAKHANMLYIEAPAGVGFSYSPDSADYVTGDNQTASDNHAALVDFFRKFPEYKSNDLYVSGESYGGIYVPTLSQKIFRDPNFPGNMKGFLCGNCVFDSCGSTQVPFTYGHGGISQDLYDEAVRVCGPAFNDTSSACRRVKDEVSSMTEELNMYDFYRDCYHSDTQTAKLKASKFNPWRVAEDGDYHHLRELLPLPRPPHPAVRRHFQQTHGQVGDSAPCIDSDGATAWLNRADVQRALHVEHSTVPSWTFCSDLIDYRDDGVYDGMKPVYRELMDTYRIVVYNGDTDPSCNYLGDEWCVKQLGADVKNKWSPWHYADSSVTSQGKQVGGWTVTYDVEGELRFITIKGAGHMAPQWRPAATTTMFGQFIRGEPFTTGDSLVNPLTV